MKELKVPDFLKIPKKNGSSYSDEELNALKLRNLHWKFANYGYGNIETVKEKIKEMVETPLDLSVVKYRQDFFSKLMIDEDRRKNIETLIKKFPTKNFVTTYWDGEIKNINLLETQRLIELPDNLNSFANYDLDSELHNDLKKFVNQFNSRYKEFVRIAKKANQEFPAISYEIGETYPSFGGKTQKRKLKKENPENSQRLIKTLKPFQNFSILGKNIREQFLNYFLFRKICEGGCKPTFLEGKENRGEIEKAIHFAYNERPSKDKYSRKSQKIKSKFGTAVANSVAWNKDSMLTLITGPNSGGKSVYLRTIGLNILLAMNGFYGLADSMKLSPVRRIWPAFDFGDGEKAGHLETGLKYFRNLAENATREDLLLMDEPAQGAEPAAEYALAKGNISKISRLGRFNSFIVTHDIEMMKEFEKEKGVAFKRVADYDDKKNKYKVMKGLAKGGYGLKLAKKIGADPNSLEKLIKERKKKGEL